MSVERVGWGFDAHRFGGIPPLILAGVEASSERGVEATSDGDVVVHAVIDAMLGACALGDLGSYFPSDDPRWHGVSSFVLLDHALREVTVSGWRPSFVDVTVVSQSVRISPIRHAMRQRLSKSLGLGPAAVSVKATTTDRMGSIGDDEGLAAVAVVTMVATATAKPTPGDAGLLSVLEGERREPGDPESAWSDALNADAASDDPVRWAAALRDIHHAQHVGGVSQGLATLMASLRERLVPLVARTAGVDEETARAAIDRTLSNSEPPLP